MTDIISELFILSFLESVQAGEYISPIFLNWKQMTRHHSFFPFDTESFLMYVLTWLSIVFKVISHALANIPVQPCDCPPFLGRPTNSKKINNNLPASNGFRWNNQRHQRIDCASIPYLLLCHCHWCTLSRDGCLWMEMLLIGLGFSLSGGWCLEGFWLAIGDLQFWWWVREYCVLGHQSGDWCKSD